LGLKAERSPQVPEPPVRIRNAEDLFEVLSTGSLGARMAVLKDIQKDPKRALALGSHKGEDFVDFLLRMIPESSGVLKKLQTLCLMSYDDSRTAAFLAEEFARCKDAATVLHLGQRLTLNEGPDFFRPYLWSPKAAQGLAAARVCSELPALETDERLRVAILLDREFAPPPIDKDTLSVWMTELRGRDRTKARQLAEKRGKESLLLWTRWDGFPDEEKVWLVDLTERLDPILAKQSVTTLMRTKIQSSTLVRAALRMEVELPASLLSSEDDEVRALAVAAGMGDDFLEDYLSPESPLPVTLAAVGRCQVDRLVSLLSDQRWQVRSKTVETLSYVKDRPLEKIRELTRHEVLGTRTAACELLLAWGDDEWLRANLLVAG
jgi:hypothetical protein